MSEATAGLHVHEAGEGRPILFLHGWSCHGGFFAAQMRALAGTARCLAPDLPGHGRTGTAGPGLSIEAAADACADLLAGRDLTDVVLVGWSMGAHVAYALMERHGTARIGGLVSVDMTPKILNDAGWSLGISGGFDAARSALALERMQADWPTYAKAVTQNMFAGGIAPDDPETASLLADIPADDPKAMAAMWASLAGQDFRPLQPAIEVPTLLIHGARSRIYDLAVGRYQAERIPNAELVVFKRSGHSPHLEEPERFTTVLRDFAAKA